MSPRRVMLVALVPMVASAVVRESGLAAFATVGDGAQTLFHGLAWVVTFACARASGLPVRRALGVVLVTIAAAMLVLGVADEAICGVLGLSEGTVKTHASRIYGKLQVQGRQDLAEVVYGPFDDGEASGGSQR